MVIILSEDYCLCTACSLLCDDIEVEIEGNSIVKIDTACLKGVSHIKGCGEPMPCTVDGETVDLDKATDEAAKILKEAEKPLIFGLSNSTLTAQEKAIELAKKLEAHIDDTSSFCQGPTLEAIFNGNVKTCTLDDVRNKADVIVYWGADPSNSHPRHLSKYTYFPRGEERQKGWEEDRTAITIDVRKSHTAIICADKFYQIPLQADEEFIEALVAALSGKVPKVSFDYDKKKILELANILKKAKFGAIFVGLGLVYSLESMEPLIKLMDKLNQVSNYHLTPMIGHYNMRGFNQQMFDETGYINRVKFDADGKATHGPENSMVELLNSKTVDAALIIGSDPLSSLPKTVAQHLKDIPLITIDPCQTLTSRKAKVTIPSTLSGVECGGSAIRMDGVKVDFNPVMETDKLSDEEIITKIMEAL